MVISGAVSWKDARAFLLANKRDIKTFPTEELALISAGAATSCTGERSFCYGNLRSQIVRIKYLNSNGEQKELLRTNQLKEDYLIEYQKEFNEKYASFKNAPYQDLKKRQT